MRPTQDINACPLPRIAYSQRPDATREAELGTLANVYKLVLDCQAKKEASRPASPDDGTKTKEDSANEDRST